MERSARVRRRLSRGRAPFSFTAKGAVPMVTTCPRCETLRSGSLPICPNCGLDYRTIPTDLRMAPAVSRNMRGVSLNLDNHKGLVVLILAASVYVGPALGIPWLVVALFLGAGLLW